MFRHLFNNLQNLTYSKNFNIIQKKVFKTKPLIAEFKFCICKNEFVLDYTDDCKCGKIILNNILSHQNNQIKVNC